MHDNQGKLRKEKENFYKEKLLIASIQHFFFIINKTISSFYLVLHKPN